MGKNRLLIVFTGVIIQLLLASCTYDYFKDETNYQVYVPEVVDNKVSDCRVLVYDETGVLVGARYEAAPVIIFIKWSNIQALIIFLPMLKERRLIRKR